MQSFLSANLNDLDLAVRAERCRRDLGFFVREFWPIIEPETPLVWGTVLEVICLHLQKLGVEYNDACFSMPPGFCKSLLCSVFWPAWKWISDPAWRLVSYSYSSVLAVRDSVKCRQILESDKFVQMIKPDWKFATDQNVKSHYKNTKSGERIASGSSGGTTGWRGDAILIDDGLSFTESLSTTTRLNRWNWCRGSAFSRINDPKTAVRLIVGQRLHDDDLIGQCLRSGDWQYLCLPLEYDPTRTIPTRIWSDWRKEKGELLFPERIGEKEVLKYRSDYAQYYECQCNQDPTFKTDSLFDISKITIVDELPEAHETVRYWDLAGSINGDYTVGLKMIYSKKAKRPWTVADIVRGRWRPGDRESVIKQTALQDGKIPIFFEEEGGSAGLFQTHEMRRILSDFAIYSDRPTGDKRTRAIPIAGRVFMGEVQMLRAPWNKAFLDELQNPEANDDQMDALSGAYKVLARFDHQ